MNKEFIPYEKALELKALGFNEPCLSKDIENDLDLPLYQQAFAFFRNKYGYTYSIGRTNICVYHLMVQGTLLTNMIQDCKSYEEAELKCLIEFINAAKQNL